MKYKIFVNSLLNLDVRLLYNAPFNYQDLYVLDNNEDEISKYFTKTTYSNITLHNINIDMIDNMEEISFWDRCMVLDFPDEETALYFMMKYPAIMECSSDV